MTFVGDASVYRFLSSEAWARVRAFGESPGGRMALENDWILPWTELQDFPDLAAEGLAPDAITELKGGWQTTLSHPRIGFPSFPHEWSPVMLQRAGELTLRLQETCLADGFTLKDATPQNVMFRGAVPVHLDTLSFDRRTAADPLWPAEAQFTRTFILPLAALRALGIQPHAGFVTRRDGLPPEEVYGWLSVWQKLSGLFFSTVTLPAWLSTQASGQGAQLYEARAVPEDRALFTQQHTVSRLKKRLARVVPDAARRSAWSDYGQTHSYSDDGVSAKADFVSQALQSRKPETVLDIGCNTGKYSLMAAGEGAQVVAIDADPVVVDAVFSQAEAKALPVLPLVVDLARPTPALGWRNGETPSFLDRAQGRFDMVLALAVIHHLMITERVPLGQIFELFASLSLGVVIAEYVGPEDPMFKALCRGRDELYQGFSEDRFREAFAGLFEEARRVDIPGSDRVLYLLAKK